MYGNLIIFVYCLSTAIAGGILFWWINGTHRVNGVGFLRRQPWPINELWIWIFVGFLVGVVIAWVKFKRRTEHTGRSREVAEELGHSFTESIDRPDAWSSLPIFTDWREGRNAMSGTQDGVAITILDYTTVTKGSDSDHVVQGTVGLVAADGVPEFDLRARTIGWRLLGVAGYEGLTFDANAMPSEFETISRFGELFHLATSSGLLSQLSGEGTVQEAASENDLRRYFQPALMARLIEFPGYSIQSRAGHLAVWFGRGTLHADRRADLWDATIALREALTQPLVENPTVIPARAGSTSGRQTKRVRNALLGGLLGVFVGFFCSAAIMSILFFNRAPGDERKLPFILEGFLFFGIIFALAAVGAWFGSRLRVRDPLPSEVLEDPLVKKKRQKRVGCAGGIGFFGGFMAGPLLFIASKILFNWNLDNFGVEGAIFFGSAGLGAVSGAVIMSMIAERLSRKA